MIYSLELLQNTNIIINDFAIYEFYAVTSPFCLLPLMYLISYILCIPYFLIQFPWKLFLSSPSVSASSRTSGASKNRDWSCQNGSDFLMGKFSPLLLVPMVCLPMVCTYTCCMSQFPSAIGWRKKKFQL